MWQWLINDCDFNVVWAGLYVNPSWNNPAHLTIRIHVVADMSRASYCRELTVCFPRAPGRSKGPLAANHYLRLHHHGAIMRAVFLFKITHCGLSKCMRVACVCVCLHWTFLLWMFLHVIVCMCMRVIVYYVSHYRPQTSLSPGPILISHLFSLTLPN